MTKYKCGHEINEVILNVDKLSMAEYLTWKDTVGFNGDKSMCWECYCKMREKEKQEENKHQADIEAMEQAEAEDYAERNAGLDEKR